MKEEFREKFRRRRDKEKRNHFGEFQVIDRKFLMSEVKKYEDGKR